MKRSLVVVGMAIGASLMYVLDPQQGRRRRAFARDKVTKAVHDTGRAMGATSRDVTHRATGLAASFHSRFFDRDAPDEVVEARVRSRLGRVSSHPGAIEVTVKNGAATLRGPVLRHEVERLLHGVSSVRGVVRVEDRLEPHDATDNVPALQGRHRLEDAETGWTPPTRLAVGVAGAVLMAVGLGRRDRIGMLLTGIGVAVATRAAGPPGLGRLAATMARSHSQPDEAQGISIPVRFGPAPEPRGPRPTGPLSDRVH